MTMSKPLVQIYLLCGLIVLGCGIYLRQIMPNPSAVVAEALAEPKQTKPTKPVFQVVANGIEYTVKPVADYDISGVIVSRHDTSVFWDYIHRAANDHLNVADLCVVWGNNLKTDNYKKLHYKNGQFTCYISTKSEAHWSAFDESALSNNHLLTNDAAIAKKLRNFKVGDQVRLKGYLAIYTHQSGRSFYRGTSMSRTDKGDGACETVFVSEAVLLKATSPLPQALRWLGAVLIAFACIAWFAFTTELDD
jgi:hypothetical protein